MAADRSAQPVDVLAVGEAEGALTPAQLAASGSIDDLHRWMRECVESRARCVRVSEASGHPDVIEGMAKDYAEADAVWRACRDELDRRNGVATFRHDGLTCCAACGQEVRT